MFLSREDLWFAVQVMFRAERKVAILLGQKGYETFHPIYKSVRKWCDRKKTIELPLFPGYVFCRLPGIVSGLVLSTPGVIRIVGFGGKPSPIPWEEIERVQWVMDSGADFNPCNYLSIGQKMKIIEGPLAGLSGLLVNIKNRRRLIISIEMITKSIAVDVGASEAVPFSVKPRSVSSPFPYRTF